MVTDMDQVCRLQQEVRDLVQDEVFDSAELLGSFLISVSNRHAVHGSIPLVGDGSHLTSLVVYADALKAKGELKRAIEYYKHGLSQCKAVRSSPQYQQQLQQQQQQDAGSKSQARKLSRGNEFIMEEEKHNQNSSGFGNQKHSNSAGSLDVGVVEAQIKFRIARCQAKMNQKQAALKTLESVNAKYRTSPMFLWMGKLYQECGMDRPTVTSYREGLRNSPYALSSILSLLRLGVNASDVAQVCSAKANPEDAKWLLTFIEAHGHFSLSQHRQALTSFAKLNQMFPNHIHTLNCMGELQLELNDRNGAMVLFQKSRAIDNKCLDRMDTFALLIRQQQDLAKLNSLTRELMEIDNTRPEPWLAVALFCDLKEDGMSALQFVCKALELDPQHVPAYHFKGSLQLRLNQAEMSVSAYYKAYSIRRDFGAYKGLVNAYLALNKLNEALRTAKEALQLMPKDARAVLLVGRVLAQTSGDGRKKASKAYAKALKLDPLCHEAALAFVDLYLAQLRTHPNTDLSPAISVMQQTLQHQSKDFLHVKLGDLYTAAKDFSAALTQYHHALSINQESDLAKLGIERLEKLIRGIDPDLDEDGEYDLDGGDYEHEI